MAEITCKSATVESGTYAYPRAAPLLDAGTGPANPGRYARWLALAVRPPQRISEVNVVVDEFTHTQVLGEGDRKEQPSIGHQGVVVEGDLHAAGVLQW